MKNNKSYIALVAMNGNTYDVVFPDFDGLVTQGDSYDDAVRNAHEALAFHIEGMTEDGLDIPEPSTVTDIKRNWWAWDDWKDTDYAITVVSLIPYSFPRKYTLVMDSQLMARVDKVTKNRSAFIAQAVQSYLGNNNKGEELLQA